MGMDGPLGKNPGLLKPGRTIIGGTNGWGIGILPCPGTRNRPDMSGLIGR